MKQEILYSNIQKIEKKFQFSFFLILTFRIFLPLKLPTPIDTGSVVRISTESIQIVERSETICKVCARLLHFLLSISSRV